MFVRKKVVMSSRNVPETRAEPQTAPVASRSNGKRVLVEVRNLKKYFPIRSGIVFQREVAAVKAVDGISFDVYEGETLGLVGESGCGKSTTGRTILQLYRATAGTVKFEGQELTTLKGEALRKMRRRMQMVFQDPILAQPRMSVGRIVTEPLVVHGIGNKKEREERVAELMELVGLNPYFVRRYPHEFSGGQRQRIGLARSLALNPQFIVADEPISALDVSIQAQVVNLLERLLADLGLTYLFIAHDLSMVRHLCDRVAVMYLGHIVEVAESEELYTNPLHPYTQALLSAVPVPDPVVEEKRQRIILKGDVPSPINPPKGCNFNTRCPVSVDVCYDQDPELIEVLPGHWVACHRVI
jgi:oligopeptide transport system ATP-binding protein